MGQGAAQAVEDGCALGVLLPRDTRPGEVAQRLALWQQCRRERGQKIVEYTRHRAREADGSQGPPQTSKSVVVIVVVAQMNWPLTVGGCGVVEEFTVAMDYCIHHDAWKHAEEQLQIELNPTVQP